MLGMVHCWTAEIWTSKIGGTSGGLPSGDQTSTGWWDSPYHIHGT